MRLRLKGCVRCGGDLRSEDGDWQCLQCGHYFYGMLTQSIDSIGQPAHGTGGSPLATPVIRKGKWERHAPQVIGSAAARLKVPMARRPQQKDYGRQRQVPEREVA